MRRFIGVSAWTVVPSGNIIHRTGAAPCLVRGWKLQDDKFIRPNDRISRDGLVIVVEGCGDSGAKIHPHPIANNESKGLIA